MGLGSTAKKIQGLSERAEQMYRQVQELQQRMVNLEVEVDDTHDTVKRLDHRLAEQRALLVAIAEEQDLDIETVLAEAAIDEAETDGSEGEESTEGSNEKAEPSSLETDS